jgi:cobalamin biosynthesis protein CbiD
MALATLARLADEIGLAKDIVAAIGAANTAEAVVETMDAHSQKVLWNEVGLQVARAVHQLMPRVKTVHVQLFAMGGQALGGGRS